MRGILVFVGILAWCGCACADVRTWTFTGGETLEGEYVVVLGNKIVLRDSRGKTRKIPLDRFSEADRLFIELENPPEFKIDFTKQSKQYSYPQKEKTYSSSELPPTVDYVFGAKLKQTSAGSYTHELHVEFFAIGEEIDGDNYILLDRQKSSFIPSDSKDRSCNFSGKKVRLYNYEYGRSGRRGQQCGGYLIVITDSRGKVIAHKTPYNWLFKHLEALREFPVGRHFDKTCTRVFPPRPREPWM